ncbi:MAG: hypothetical protein IJQ82_06170 [Selenomonadaceae bacterium]|nr:hypothetical protein [Selenomonadaceae bacterium]
MAVEDKYADEMLTDDELDKVAGGTYDEWLELAKFFPSGNWSNGTSAGAVGIRASGKSYKDEDWIKDWLKRNLNIEAEIDGTRFLFYRGSRNTYTRNGESLTHEQVVKEVRAIRGSY